MNGLLDGTPAQSTGRIYGVVVGTVSDNKDPDGRGRVKVSFPWLGDDQESDWAPVATLMAGKERGAFFLPEVGDTVLCAFEHGDVRFPYVVGALYNGKEPPPETNDDGKNNRRVIVSRSGSILRFDDTDGSEKIEIMDKDEKHVIRIDVGGDTISITAESGNIELKAAKGKVLIKGEEVAITATKSKVTVEGPDVAIKASKGKAALDGQEVAIKAQASGKFQASAGLDLKSDATLNIKGALVNIN